MMYLGVLPADGVGSWKFVIGWALSVRMGVDGALVLAMVLHAVFFVVRPVTAYTGEGAFLADGLVELDGQVQEGG